jgi:hypothetical protein
MARMPDAQVETDRMCRRSHRTVPGSRMFFLWSEIGHGMKENIMTENRNQATSRVLNDNELMFVSGGTKDLLGGLPSQIPYIGAFLSGYYSTCGCVSTGHSANWQG